MLHNKSLVCGILDKIEAEGFEAFLVGGYVRDLIMGKPSDDIDITTSATPEDIKEIFSGYDVIETGIRHGTVTVVYENKPVEITTYRTESAYVDNRHPEEVAFCRSLTEDLKRRDFTVNALCMDKNGNITDIFDGQGDIKKQSIKAIGDAEKRFNEDALRILRAMRFASVLGFNIEENTSNAIHKCKHLILNIANERVSAELRKMIIGKNIRKILLEYSDVFALIIPELAECIGFEQHNFHHKYDVYTHIATVVENTPAKDYLRLSALFHDCGKPDCFSVDEKGIGHFYSHASISSAKAVKSLKRLKFDNNTISRVELFVKQHDAYIDEEERIIKRKLNRFGEEMLRDLISLQKADTMGLADEFHKRITHFKKLEGLIDDVLKDNKCFALKDLDVNGNDIIDLGYKGKDIGSALSYLVEAVIDEKVINEKNSLLNYLKENS